MDGVAMCYACLSVLWKGSDPWKGSDRVNGLGKQTEAPENRLPDLTSWVTAQSRSHHGAFIAMLAMLVVISLACR
jgi:hypothetical protein